MNAARLPPPPPPASSSAMFSSVADYTVRSVRIDYAPPLPAKTLSRLSLALLCSVTLAEVVGLPKFQGMGE